MGWLKKLLGREHTHDEWLAKHPGKESKNAPPPAVSESDQADTRARMEREMAEQSKKRDS